jgi:hypothetical protein
VVSTETDGLFTGCWCSNYLIKVLECMRIHKRIIFVYYERLFLLERHFELPDVAYRELVLRPHRSSGNVSILGTLQGYSKNSSISYILPKELSPLFTEHQTIGLSHARWDHLTFVSRASRSFVYKNRSIRRRIRDESETVYRTKSNYQP